MNAPSTTPASYPWPVKPFDQQHPVRGFFCDPRISGGGRTFHFGVDIAAPAGTPVYAVTPGKVSYGSPGDVAANGGIVVVEAAGRNFGYWHVSRAVQPGTRVPLHGLIGHIADQPEDWGHVHFAESTHGAPGITYWNPLRTGALTPFFDYGAPVVGAILTSLPSSKLHGLVDLSVRAHDNTPIPITQPDPPGWEGMPVTPAQIRWRLTRAAQPIVPWQTGTDHTISLHPDVQGNPPTDVNFAAVYAPDTAQNNPNQPGSFHFWLKRGFDTTHYPDGNYQLEVEASDTRGNTGTHSLAITLANTNPGA
jgi:Peptidase family M23